MKVMEKQVMNVMISLVPKHPNDAKVLLGVHVCPVQGQLPPCAQRSWDRLWIQHQNKAFTDDELIKITRKHIKLISLKSQHGDRLNYVS